MATGNEQQYVDGNLQILPGSAVEAMRTYSVEEIESLVQGLLPDPTAGYPASFSLGGTITYTVGAAVGDTHPITCTAAPTKRRHAAALEMRDRDGAAASARWGIASWRNTDDGFSAVPTKILAGEVIQVGVRINDYPTGATTDTSGQHFLDRWTHGIGEHPTINSVTNLAPGLRLKITHASLWRAWSDGAQTRPCTVWLDDPETSGTEAIYTGVLQSDGVDVYVDVPHWFGQTGAPSLVVGDYTIHAHGFTFSVKSGFDLTAQATNGVDTYLVLAEYDKTTGTYAYTPQLVVPTLQEIVSSGLYGINPVLAALRMGARSGCFIGSYGETRDWNAVANVVVNSGVDPVTLTYGTAVLTTDEGRYFFCGDETNSSAPHLHRLCNRWQTSVGVNSGHIATIAKSQPTGTYAVIATAEPYEYNPMEYAVQLKVIDAAAPPSDFLAREILPICTFNFTTGTGAVAGMTPFDLSQRRGISDGSLIGDGDDGAGNLYQPLITGEIVGAETFRVMLRNNVGVNYQVSPFLEALTSTATERSLYLRAASGSGNLSSETVDLHFGGPNDYILLARDNAGTRQLELWSNGGIVGYHYRAGGEGSTGTDRLEFHDYHVTSGKPVCRMVPLEGAWGDVDPYHVDGIDRAIPDWDIASEISQQLTTDVPVVLARLKVADGYSVVVGDEFNIRANFWVEDPDGVSLDQLYIYIESDSGDDLIWGATDFPPYGATIALSSDDLAYIQMGLRVTSLDTGAGVGQAAVFYEVESYDASGGPAPFGPAGTPECVVHNLYSSTIDFRGDVYIKVSGAWSALGGASPSLYLEHLRANRSRRDLWRTNRDDGWYLETGDGRELRIPLPVNVDNNHTLTSAEVWCAVLSGGAATCRLVLDVMEYDPTTGNETSLLGVGAAVNKENNSFADPVTLICNPANPTMDSDKRYYIKIVSEQTTAGGQFAVRSAQINTVLHQIQ